MGAIDKEAAEVYSILGNIGISKDRCLFTMKKGWINITIDGKLFLEFNRKDSFHLNERGERVDEVIYKFKENGRPATTTQWNILRSIIVKEAEKLKL